VTFLNFGVDWAKSYVYTLSKSAFEDIMPFPDTYLREAGFSSKSIKRNSDLDWFPKMTWEHHFQLLFQECQILCVEN